MNQRPTIGRIVHYVVDRDLGEHRPAIVTHVWDDTLCNLQVFTDGQNDQSELGMFWQSSVENDEDYKETGTWHWPEREETDA
jgi:hypothetical protein